MELGGGLRLTGGTSGLRESAIEVLINGSRPNASFMSVINFTVCAAIKGLLVDAVYDVQGPLHVKAEDKKTWKKLDCVLRTTGLCCESTPAGGATGKQGARQGDVTCLQSLGEVDIYLGVDWRKKFKSPTEHGIALKVCRPKYTGNVIINS